MAIDVTLAGPVSGPCGNIVGFQIHLSAPAPDPITWTAESSEGGDSISLVPPIMPAGLSEWGFFLTPSSCGPRTITIGSDADPDDINLVIDHVTYDAQCTCPSDTGETQQSAAFHSVVKNCGGHAFQFSFTPESVAERDLYGDAPVAVLITE